MPPKSIWMHSCTPFQKLILDALLTACLSERPTGPRQQNPPSERVPCSESFTQKVRTIMEHRRCQYGHGGKPLPSFDCLRKQLSRIANHEKTEADRILTNASGRQPSNTEDAVPAAAAGAGASSAASTPRAQRVRHVTLDNDDDSSDETKPNPAALEAQDALDAEKARKEARDRKPDRAALDRALGANSSSARKKKRPRKDNEEESSADEAKPNPAALGAERAADLRRASERAKEMQAKQEARVRAAKKRKHGSSKEDAFVINSDDESASGGPREEDSFDESSEYSINAWDIKSEMGLSEDELEVKQEG